MPLCNWCAGGSTLERHQRARHRSRGHCEVATACDGRLQRADAGDLRAGTEEVPCPSLTTITLPEALGYQAGADRNTVDCPDVTELCNTTVPSPGELSCGATSDCRERGVCMGGRCRCPRTHRGPPRSAVRRRRVVSRAFLQV